MTADPRWQRLLDLLRPRARTDRPSRRAVVGDALLAAVLTIAALIGAYAGDGETPHPVPGLLYLPMPPALPTPGLPAPDVTASALPTPVMPLPVLPEAGGTGPALFLAAVTALPLALRRRYPLGVFWVVLTATLAMDGGVTWITVLTMAIAAYSAVAHSRNRVPAVASLLLAAVLAGAAGQDILPSLPTWLGPYVILLSAGALASFVRFWQRNRAKLADVREITREAVQAERSRIAGELHDVVTHNVSVMVIQAGAARKVLGAHPDQCEEALKAIEASGRAAMAELRTVMGLLASQEGGLEPQPGLDRLGDLIERVRAAGVAVDATITPPPGPLPPGVDLAVYRVVQEGLTNTMKHAAGARAAVTVGHDGDRLEIEVTDDGGTRPAPSRSGGGRGLIGLRERLALYGGTLEAAPRDGGYRLRAHIPWRAA